MPSVRRARRAAVSALIEAAYEFENREVHEGMHTLPRCRARARAPRFQCGAARAVPGQTPPPNETRSSTASYGTASGRVRVTREPFGYAIATLFGVRVPPPQPFLNGFISFAPDPALFQNVALIVIAAVCCGNCRRHAGLLHRRFITQQAIQPLVDVTEACSVLPRATSAAIDHARPPKRLRRPSARLQRRLEQVSAAFAEREAAEAQMRQFVAERAMSCARRSRSSWAISICCGAGERRGRALEVIFSSIAAEGRRMRTLVDNLCSWRSSRARTRAYSSRSTSASSSRRSSTCARTRTVGAIHIERARPLRRSPIATKCTRRWPTSSTTRSNTRPARRFASRARCRMTASSKLPSPMRSGFRRDRERSSSDSSRREPRRS